MVSKKQVTVRPMGQRAKKVTVPSNATVKEILAAANIDFGSEKVKFVANGDFLTKGKTLGKHKELIIIPEVKGGI